MCKQEQKNRKMMIQIKIEDKELFDRLDEAAEIFGVNTYSETIRRLIKYGKL
jgi:metal-responsive CopG/Arc/MetJ family transcriptional regulator